MYVRTTLEQCVEAKLDKELLSICESNDADTLDSVLQQRSYTTPDYEPPLSMIMAAAVYHDSSAIVNYCLSKKAEVVEPTMTFFAQRKAWASYQFLVEAGAININYTGEVYSDMLSIAVFSGERERVLFCLEHGADPNLNLIEDYKTVLASAAEEGCIDITALLLEYGAVLNGGGALVLAAEDGRLEMVKYLLDRGADIDEVGVEHPHDPTTKEDVGSALHHAIEDRHIEVARFLIQSGASLDLKNGRGKSAREQAEEEGLVELVEMMRNRSEYR